MPNYKNSSFKVKAGSAPTTLGLEPEGGAILFHRGLQEMFFADGFNWLPFNQEIDSLAVSMPLEADPLDLTADTPAPFSFFDAVNYNIGDNFSTNIPAQQITSAAAHSVQLNLAFGFRVDTGNQDLTWQSLINGSTISDGYVTSVIGKNDTQRVSLSFPLEIGLGETLAFQVTAEKNTELIITDFNLGVQIIV